MCHICWPQVKIVGFARLVQIKGTVSDCEGLSPNMVNFYPGPICIGHVLPPRSRSQTVMSNIVNLGLINVVTVVGLFLLAEHGSAQEAYQTWMRLLLTLAWHTLFGKFAVAGACYPTALPGTYLQLGNYIYIYSYSCVRLHKCFLIWLWLYDVIKWIPPLLPQQIGEMWINKALNCYMALYLRDHCKTKDYATVCNCFMGVHVLFISLSGDFSAHSCLLFVHSFSFKLISKDPCHFDCCTFHVQFHLFSKNPGPADLCLLPLY